MKILYPIRTETDTDDDSETNHTHPNLEMLNSLTIEERLLKSDGVPTITPLETEDW